MKKIKRRFIYILAVVLVCTILVIAWFKFPFWNDEEEYYTMREAVYESSNNERFYDNESDKPKPKEYRIKDKVLYIKNITLPEWEVNQNEEEDNLLNFTKNKTTAFVSVGFKSMSGHPLFFNKDINISFKLGRVNKFTLKTEEYQNIRTGSGFWSTIEPDYMRDVLMDYEVDIIKNHFESLNVEVSKNYDNRTNRFNATLRFGQQYDFFPSNREWDELYIDQPSLSIDHSAIYDRSGKFLSKFENNTLNRSIQEGDRLVLNGHFNKGLKKDISPYPLDLIIKTELYDIPECENPSSFAIYCISFEE